MKQADAGIKRLDGLDKVTGGIRYATDFALPGMAHAKILRSPHAHARIHAIDAGEAESLPGVLAVVTAAHTGTLPEPYYGVGIRDQPLLAVDKVRYVGDMVAAVVADDEQTAYRALELIEVTYEALPAVMTMDAALSPGAPLLFDTPSLGAALPVGEGALSLKEPRPNVLYEFRYARGDVDSVLASADHVFTDTFVTSRINHLHLEPYVNVARVADGRIEVWSCNQDPFILRADIARIFGRSLNDVRIHTPSIGGGFGGKSYCKMEPLVAFLADYVRRPVRLCLTMDEALLTLTKHACVLTLTTGVSSKGELLARKCTVMLDGGAYSDASVSTTIKAGYRMPGCYRWMAVETTATAVRTNTIPAGSFRGFGGTQASFASESQIDMIARRLGTDPVIFRHRNLLAPGEAFAPGDSEIDSDFAVGLDKVYTALGAKGPKRPCRGRGVAIGLKDGGGTGNQANAMVKVTHTGTIMVHAASVEVGQGTGTALAAIAAEVFDCPLNNVRYGDIDTDYTPLDTGTHVSFATTVGGLAVQRAAQDARAQILAFAAEQLGCDAGNLKLTGWAVQRGNDVTELTPLMCANFGAVGTEFIGRGQAKIPYEKSAPLGSKNFFWLPCWSGAEVEVDVETGQVSILHLIVGVDAGRIVNPTACRGQAEGAALQAYGQALIEDLVYVGEAPANATPITYRAPLSTDSPFCFESFVEEHGMGPGPGGIKGLGESGMLGVAAAIANAVHDAVGVRITDLPITPEKVLNALDSARQAVAKERE
jgi:CO/xanthine dehydrogenase Mo-binding subunit